MRKPVYTHAAKKVGLDMKSSPYLKPKFGTRNGHNLEVYLLLMEGSMAKVSASGKVNETLRW